MCTRFNDRILIHFYNMFTLKKDQRNTKSKIRVQHKVQFNFEFILFIFNRFFSTWKNEAENKSYVIIMSL